MSEIQRNVILDLLPIYVSGEASPETNDLVRRALDADPSLAALAERSSRELSDAPPPSMRGDRALEIFRVAKRAMLVRTLGLAAIAAFSILALLAFVGAAVLFLSH